MQTHLRLLSCLLVPAVLQAGARADASAMRLELAPPFDGDARPLLDLLYGFRKSKTLFCAVQLGVFDGWPAAAVGLLGLVTYLLLMPAVFRWSRILWIHLGARIGW